MKNKFTNLKSGRQRTISLVLTLTMLINAEVSGIGAKTNTENKPENKFSNFVKKHPVITSGVGIGGSIPVLAGGAVGIIKLAEVLGGGIECTPVDGIPDNQIKTYLDTQIRDFISYGQYSDTGENLFSVSDQIKNEANPRVLALVFKSINMLFEKNNFFADTLKAKLKKEGHKLKIDWGKDYMYDGLFCSLNTVTSYGEPYVLEINKIYGKSSDKTKKYSIDHRSPQSSIIWNIGYFLNECIIPKSKQLTIERIFKSAETKIPAYNENNRRFNEEVFMRCDPCPFADLLSDYVLGTYSHKDILIQIFEDYVGSLTSSSPVLVSSDADRI